MKKTSARRKGQAATIDQVAALARVSPMTVSRVINGAEGVRAPMRERVMRAVDKLGYTPNIAASSLAAARETRIALIYSNPSANYLRELLLGALRGASSAAVQLVIDTWDGLDAEGERNAARLLARGVSGVILPPPLCESEAVVGELTRSGVSVVAIASERFHDTISCVRIDDFQASCEMTGYLVAQGHRRIGYIKGNPNQTASARRFAGYREALKRAGIRYNGTIVEQGYFTYRSGLDASERLLDLKNPPTAIVASNDDMAAAAISVAHRRGLDVPRDLTVVGYDDTAASTMVWPELTTIHQPIADMADSAIEVLLRDIRRKEGEDRKLVDRVVAHSLVQRDSVAPPNRDAG